MEAAAKKRADDERKVDATFHEAFNLISSAQDLMNDLPRQQYFAQQADPRDVRYQSRMLRTWDGRSWGYTGPSISIWRTNSDNAIEQWQIVVNTIDQIGQLGTQARNEVDWLKEQSANWPPNDQRADGLAVLEKDLGELLANGQSLQVQRDQAVSQINFFRQNRNRPTV